MAIDLHIHTAASSDGEFSSQEIIHIAAVNHLRTIAITDHDSIQNVESALYWGKKMGIEVIPGCEFSSVYKKKWLHILGYFIDYRHSDVKQWSDKAVKACMERIDKQIAKLREAGFYLEKDKVLEGGPRPLSLCYSNAVFGDPRNDHNQLVNQYRLQENGAIKFCLDWVATGRPYNVPQDLPDAKEAIRLIRKIGGVPVLAHPAATLGIVNNAIINDLLEVGLEGIEAFTTWHTIEQEDYYFQLCKQKGIIATCGSDFHGKNKPHIHMGQVRNNSDHVAELLKDLKRMSA